MPNSVTETIEAEFTKYPKRTYPKGQILLFADESPEHIFYLTKGKVRQYDVSYRGDEIVLNIFKPGAFFPMSWVLNRSQNRYFYKTEEEAVVHIVPPDDVLAFVQREPAVLLDLLQRIYRGIDGLLEKMSQLMSGNAHTRLLNELATECHRFGTPEKDGSYRLRVSEIDLAARSGLSRETISREMRKLKNRGWITLTSKTIVVLDLAAIERSINKDSLA